MKLKTKPSPVGFLITVGNAALTVNPMTASELTRMREAYTTINRGVEKMDGAKLTAAMFDRVVQAWGPVCDADGVTVPGSGINDEEGLPLECTSANKRLIYEHNPDFVADVLKEMEETNKERRLSQEGNLPPLLSGTSAKGK